MKLKIFSPIIALFCFITIAFLVRNYSLDFTKNRVFSLSDYSIKIVSELPSNLRIEYYHSISAAAEAPEIRANIKQISALLNQYERKSNGKIDLREIETKELSDEEAMAIQSGMVPIRENENKLSPIYSGILLKDQKHELIIPLLDARNGQSIEFEITKGISQFHQGKLKPIGIISNLDWFASPRISGPAEVAAIARTIVKENPAIAFEANWSKIPTEISALIITQPNAISQEQNQKLIEFINNGKSAFICIDPASSTSNDNDNSVATNDLSIAPFLQYFGLNINGEIVMDMFGALRIATKDNNIEKILPQPLFFTAHPTSDYVGNFGAVNFATSGFIEINAKPEFDYQIIFKTSKQSSKTNSAVALANQNPSQLIREYEDHQTEYPIAAIAQSKKNAGKILIVADCDFLSDGLYKNGDLVAASNADFALGAIDFLLDENDIAQLRLKTKINGGLAKVEAIKAQAESEIAIREGILNQKIETIEQEVSQNPNTPMLNSLRDEIAKSRSELRELKEGVKRQIQGLKNLMIFVCGFLFPFCFLMFGLFYYQRRKNAHNS